MLVSLNLLLDHDKLDNVIAELDNFPQITRVDSSLRDYDVLVVYVKRTDARTIRDKLQDINGVISTALGAVATVS